MTPHSRSVKSGFTLFELLVVIAIIGVLVALLFPAVEAAREAARRIQCTSSLKNVALATHNYHDSHGQMPPAYQDFVDPSSGNLEKFLGHKHQRALSAQLGDISATLPRTAGDL